MDALREFIEGRVPNEWVRVPGNEVAFERDGLRVKAKRATTPQRFGLEWEIRCRRSVGEAVDQRTVQCVASRAEALEAVYDCVRRLDTDESPVDGTYAAANGYTVAGGYPSGAKVRSDTTNASPQVEPEA